VISPLLLTGRPSSCAAYSNDTLDQAQQALAATKAECGGFVAEAPSPRLAAWAGSAGRTTDAYLAQLAAAHGLTLATFDRRIPAATRIG
jgi:predicted nucleic acid-binding protein